jgi:hypothetical protein
MPTWTISAPKDFQESVKETSNKLGLSYGEYLRRAHKAYLESLTSVDFERAKKLIELSESKERLGSLRERETVLLREKGYKDKNVQRILNDVEDEEIKNEIKRLAKLREDEADTQLKLHEELNPTNTKPLGHLPKQNNKLAEKENNIKSTRMRMFNLDEKQYNTLLTYSKGEKISFGEAVENLIGGNVFAPKKE